MQNVENNKRAWDRTRDLLFSKIRIIHYRLSYTGLVERWNDVDYHTGTLN